MGIIGGRLGYYILKRLFPQPGTHMDGSVYVGKSKLEVTLGSDIWEKIAGKDVIDFGCGTGQESIEMAQRGARSVLGVDIQEQRLEVGRHRAAELGLNNISFASAAPQQQADVVVSLDAFEHFGDPLGMMNLMASLLRPGGRVLASFGPTWYHPLGGHYVSVFPWAHLVFTEHALCRWRSQFKTDGATRYAEVEGGLNKMTIRRFERTVARSRLRIVKLDPVPIRRLRPLHNRLTREFFTSVVRCELANTQH